MVRDRVVDRWFALEMRGVHEGLVVKKRSLAELLEEEDPQTVTREGAIHRFDRGVLERLAAAATEEERGRLRLPITLRFHLDLEDACSLEDAWAVAVLRRLERFGRAYPFRDGRAWLPYSLGLALLMRYPTAIQRILAP